MPRGGKRTAAGRKASSLTAKSRAIAQIAIEEGITPLEVMLRAMRAYANSEQWDRAASIAKDAAPYLHPKLSPVEATHKDQVPQNAANLSLLTDDELNVLEDLTRKMYQ